MIDPASFFPASVTQKVVTPDGRTLCFADWGGDGYPVLSLHGAPGCRLSVRLPPIATSLGGRLITYDRPGCGQSYRLAGRPGGIPRSYRSDRDLADDAGGLHQRVLRDPCCTQKADPQVVHIGTLERQP